MEELDQVSHREWLSEHSQKCCKGAYCQHSTSQILRCQQVGCCSIYIITHYVHQEAHHGKIQNCTRQVNTMLGAYCSAHAQQTDGSYKNKLEGYPIQQVHGWVDSTTTLYWLKGKGTWSQFVRNRIKAIN